MENQVVPSPIDPDSLPVEDSIPYTESPTRVRQDSDEKSTMDGLGNGKVPSITL